MSDFTPGKWMPHSQETRNHQRYIMGDEQQCTIVAIAEDMFGNDVERDANARLIAAAPEMYKFLREVCDHTYTNLGDADALTETDGNLWGDILALLRYINDGQ